MEQLPVRNWIEEHRQEFIEDMMEFFRIRSVSEPQGGEFPFGEGCAQMLDAALSMSERYGFSVENHEYYCGSAILKGSEDSEIGIFSHVDVVDEGSGWETDPYEPVIKDGWIYARGSSDNKGPAVASLYALRYLKEQGIPLKHTIRLYYGCSEEHGMEDIMYYKEHYSLPAFSIVPDASFPVCYGEKGILEGTLERKLEGNVISFTAGHANNAVPAQAEAILTGVDIEEANRKLDDRRQVRKELAGKQTVQEELDREPDITLGLTEDGLVTVSGKGKTAHAAFPEGSESAAVKLADYLIESGLADHRSVECLRFVRDAFEGYYGNGMGIACEDRMSGKLTMIGGMVKTTDGVISQTMNIRYPASIDQEKLISGIKKSVNHFGWKTRTFKNNPSHAIDPEDKKVKKLTQICENVWQRHFEPYAMGGGTYARKLPNAVAYGPGILDQKKPGWPDHGKGHQPDECVCIENMMKAVEIYALALLAMDDMVH